MINRIQFVSGVNSLPMSVELKITVGNISNSSPTEVTEEKNQTLTP
jgi:hypothetical protein